MMVSHEIGVTMWCRFRRL